MWYAIQHNYFFIFYWISVMNDSDHDRSDKEGEEVFCVKLY